MEIENHKYLVQARDKFPDTKNAFPEVFEKVSRIGREGRLKSSWTSKNSLQRKLSILQRHAIFSTEKKWPKELVKSWILYLTLQATKHMTMNFTVTSNLNLLIENHFYISILYQFIFSFVTMIIKYKMLHSGHGHLITR